MKRLLLAAAATAALATGCYTQGDVGAGYSYGYAAPAPDLYYMSPGVSVVAYADYPTFYSDGYYWMYRDNVWYSSSYYGGGWAVSYNVPTYVRSIDRPYSYARFQPGAGWSRVSSPSYGYNGGVRDHRTYGNGGYNGGYTPPPTNGGVRDHRTYGGGAGPSTYTPPPARQSMPTYQPSGGVPTRQGGSAPAMPHQVPSRQVPGGVRDHRR
jgi:hypothetical protein